MADMEELAIVQYAGRPHPIMIRYMLDEAKGNNVNARTLKVWDGIAHCIDRLGLYSSLGRNVSHSRHIPFASRPVLSLQRSIFETFSSCPTM